VTYKQPALPLLAAVAGGILLADVFEIGAWLFLAGGFVGFLILLWIYYRRVRWLTCLAGLVTLAMLSAFNLAFRYRTFPPGHIIHFVDDGRCYEICGRIDDWPDLKYNRTSLILGVDSLAHRGRAIKSSGRILINIQTETTRFQCGDRVRFSGRLYGIAGGSSSPRMDYRRYLNLKGVFAQAYLSHEYSLEVSRSAGSGFLSLIGSWRRYITDVFRRSLNPEEAALASGFLIGETRDIPRETYLQFKNSGTLHLLAVSGSNVALVLLVFVFFLRGSPLGRVTRTAILMVIVVVFMFLAFNQPSVVRAGLMASLILLGRFFQRKIDHNRIIATAALIILIFSPAQLFDIGFQLSFATAWGLILMVPRAVRCLAGIKSTWYYRFLVFPGLVCFIAQLVSLPLVAYYFQKVPALSIVSNLLIIPLVSIGVIGEVSLIPASLFHPLLGDFIGGWLNPVLSLVLCLVRWFGSGALSFPVGGLVGKPILVLYYVFLLLVLFAAGSARLRKVALVYFLVAANGLLVIGLVGRDQPNRLHCLPVSAGFVAVGEVVSPLVILSDLPAREYSITEEILLTFPVDREQYSLILLSNDYSTLREGVTLLKRRPPRAVYLPHSARNAFLDIVAYQGINLDTGGVSYFADDWSIEEIDATGWYLGGGWLVCRSDSATVVFAAGGSSGGGARPDVSVLKGAVFIKAVMTESDLDYLSGGDISPEGLVCCHWKGRPFSRDRPAAIFEMRQHGAVEVVMENGRVRIRN